MAIAQAVSADGTRIDVHTTGSGPGVVLLHGAGVSVGEYRRLAAGLSDRLTVHRYNRRGRPGTAPLRGDETAATDQEDLAAVLALTGATGVFGHSGGAFVALQAGLSLPVERIAVYDPAVAVEGVEFPRHFVDEFEEAVAAGDEVRAMRVMSQDVNRSSPATKLPVWLQDLIVRGYLRTSWGRQLAELLPTTAPEVRRILAAERPASHYAGISAAVLLARGARSEPYYGPICTALAAAIPRGRAVVVPRCSHNSANVAPTRFVDVFAGFFGRK